MFVQQNTIGVLKRLCSVQQSITEALGKMYSYSRIFRNTREAVLIQQGTTGAIARLNWHSRGLKEHSESVLVQQSL